jgi:hypothetical protein
MMVEQYTLLFRRVISKDHIVLIKGEGSRTS